MHEARDTKNFTRLLYSKYRNPTHRIFLDSDVGRLYATAKRDPDLQPVTRCDIVDFKDSLSTLSQSEERRILRGRKRHLSYRKWKCYGPNNILLGDLAFLRDIRSQKGSRYTILVFIDAFRYSLLPPMLRQCCSFFFRAALDSKSHYFGWSICLS